MDVEKKAKAPSQSQISGLPARYARMFGSKYVPEQALLLTSALDAQTRVPHQEPEQSEARCPPSGGAVSPFQKPFAQEQRRLHERTRTVPRRDQALPAGHWRLGRYRGLRQPISQAHRTCVIWSRNICQRACREKAVDSQIQRIHELRDGPARHVCSKRFDESGKLTYWSTSVYLPQM